MVDKSGLRFNLAGRTRAFSPSNMENPILELWYQYHEPLIDDYSLSDIVLGLSELTLTESRDTIVNSGSFTLSLHPLLLTEVEEVLDIFQYCLDQVASFLGRPNIAIFPYPTIRSVFRSANSFRDIQVTWDIFVRRILAAEAWFRLRILPFSEPVDSEERETSYRLQGLGAPQNTSISRVTAGGPNTLTDCLGVSSCRHALHVTDCLASEAPEIENESPVPQSPARVSTVVAVPTLTMPSELSPLLFGELLPLDVFSPVLIFQDRTISSHSRKSEGHGLVGNTKSDVLDLVGFQDGGDGSSVCNLRSQYSASVTPEDEFRPLEIGSLPLPSFTPSLPISEALSGTHKWHSKLGVSPSPSVEDTRVTNADGLVFTDNRLTPIRGRAEPSTDNRLGEASSIEDVRCQSARDFLARTHSLGYESSRSLSLPLDPGPHLFHLYSNTPSSILALCRQSCSPAEKQIFRGPDLLPHSFVSCNTTMFRACGNVGGIAVDDSLKSPNPPAIRTRDVILSSRRPPLLDPGPSLAPLPRLLFVLLPELSRTDDLDQMYSTNDRKWEVHRVLEGRDDGGDGYAASKAQSGGLLVVKHCLSFVNGGLRPSRPIFTLPRSLVRDSSSSSHLYKIPQTLTAGVRVPVSLSVFGWPPITSSLTVRVQRLTQSPLILEYPRTPGAFSRIEISAKPARGHPEELLETERGSRCFRSVASNSNFSPIQSRLITLYTLRIFSHQTFPVANSLSPIGPFKILRFTDTSLSSAPAQGCWSAQCSVRTNVEDIHVSSRTAVGGELDLVGLYDGGDKFVVTYPHLRGILRLLVGTDHDLGLGSSFPSLHRPSLLDPGPPSSYLSPSASPSTLLYSNSLDSPAIRPISEFLTSISVNDVSKSLERSTMVIRAWELMPSNLPPGPGDTALLLPSFAVPSYQRRLIFRNGPSDFVVNVTWTLDFGSRASIADLRRGTHEALDGLDDVDGHAVSKVQFSGFIIDERRPSFAYRGLQPSRPTFALLRLLGPSPSSSSHLCTIPSSRCPLSSQPSLTPQVLRASRLALPDNRLAPARGHAASFPENRLGSALSAQVLGIGPSRNSTLFVRTRKRLEQRCRKVSEEMDVDHGRKVKSDEGWELVGSQREMQYRDSSSTRGFPSSPPHSFASLLSPILPASANTSLAIIGDVSVPTVTSSIVQIPAPWRLSVLELLPACSLSLASIEFVVPILVDVFRPLSSSVVRTRNFVRSHSSILEKSDSTGNLEKSMPGVKNPALVIHDGDGFKTPTTPPSCSALSSSSSSVLAVRVNRGFHLSNSDDTVSPDDATPLQTSPSSMKLTQLSIGFDGILSSNISESMSTRTLYGNTFQWGQALSSSVTKDFSHILKSSRTLLPHLLLPDLMLPIADGRKCGFLSDAVNPVVVIDRDLSEHVAVFSHRYNKVVGFIIGPSCWGFRSTAYDEIIGPTTSPISPPSLPFADLSSPSQLHSTCKTLNLAVDCRVSRSPDSFLPMAQLEDPKLARLLHANNFELDSSYGWAEGHCEGLGAEGLHVVEMEHLHTALPPSSSTLSPFRFSLFNTIPPLAPTDFAYTLAVLLQMLSVQILYRSARLQPRSSLLTCTPLHQISPLRFSTYSPLPFVLKLPQNCSWMLFGHSRQRNFCFTLHCQEWGALLPPSRTPYSIVVEFLGLFCWGARGYRYITPFIGQRTILWSLRKIDIQGRYFAVHGRDPLSGSFISPVIPLSRARDKLQGFSYTVLVRWKMESWSLEWKVERRGALKQS